MMFKRAGVGQELSPSTAMTRGAMQNVYSKEARRFKRLQDEELSRMKARGEL